MDMLALQQTVFALVSLITGKSIEEILAMEVHERCVLLDGAVGHVKGLTSAMSAGSDPNGPGGVALTQSEIDAIVAEAANIHDATSALIAYRS